MRIIIAGNARNMNQDDLLKIVNDSGFQVDEVSVDVSSTIGPLVKRWAAMFRIPCWTYAPQVRLYRRLARMMLDRSMVAKADGLILIWDGNDSKFRNLRFLARGSGLKVYEQIIEKA